MGASDDRSGWWYLARTRTACGVGTAGDDGAGSERSVTDCP